MNIEKVLDGIRYTLTNDNLEVNDKVYPIARGRVCDDGTFILHEITYSKLFGFPYEPHTILDLKHNGGEYKSYEIRTDMGYSPKECYFKIIKKEHQVKTGEIFSITKWVEIK